MNTFTQRSANDAMKGKKDEMNKEDVSCRELKKNCQFKLGRRRARGEAWGNHSKKMGEEVSSTDPEKSVAGQIEEGRGENHDGVGRLEKGTLLGGKGKGLGLRAAHEGDRIWGKRERGYCGIDVDKETIPMTKEERHNHAGKGNWLMGGEQQMQAFDRQTGNRGGRGGNVSG